MNVKTNRPEDRQELRARIQKELNAKQRDRYRAVLLALDSQPTKDIMGTLARSKNIRTSELKYGLKTRQESASNGH